MAGLYVHIPFCHSKCSYCDFFSTPSEKMRSEYADAVVGELSLRRGEFGGEIKTLYFGGGTPSSLPFELFERLLRGISRSVDLSPLEEFTVEVNPEDLTPELLDGYRRLGVNRISMGVQSFDDDMLRAINRRHDAACSHRALRLLSESGINYSADLIFGLPGQTSDDWCRSIETLLSYRPPHFSAYLLSYEPGTRLYAALQAGKVEEASEQLASEMYGIVCDAARAVGYEHYEISNYALPGMASLHNSSYWTGIPYLGLGVSAHSFDGIIRRFNPINIKDYIASISSGRSYAAVDDETMTDRLNDRLITAMRTSEGLDLTKLRSDFGEKLFERLVPTIETLLVEGAVVTQGQNIVIPERHWLLADSILRRLILIDD